MSVTTDSIAKYGSKIKSLNKDIADLKLIIKNSRDNDAIIDAEDQLEVLQSELQDLGKEFKEVVNYWASNEGKELLGRVVNSDTITEISVDLISHRSDVLSDLNRITANEENLAKRVKELKKKIKSEKSESAKSVLTDEFNKLVQNHKSVLQLKKSAQEELAKSQMQEQEISKIRPFVKYITVTDDSSVVSSKNDADVVNTKTSSVNLIPAPVKREKSIVSKAHDLEKTLSVSINHLSELIKDAQRKQKTVPDQYHKEKFQADIDRHTDTLNKTRELLDTVSNKLKENPVDEKYFTDLFNMMNVRKQAKASVNSAPDNIASLDRTKSKNLANLARLQSRLANKVRSYEETQSKEIKDKLYSEIQNLQDELKKAYETTGKEFNTKLSSSPSSEFTDQETNEYIDQLKKYAPWFSGDEEALPDNMKQAIKDIQAGAEYFTNWKPVSHTTPESKTEFTNAIINKLDEFKRKVVSIAEDSLKDAETSADRKRAFSRLIGDFYKKEYAENLIGEIKGYLSKSKLSNFPYTKWNTYGAAKTPMEKFRFHLNVIMELAKFIDQDKFNTLKLSTDEKKKIKDAIDSFKQLENFGIKFVNPESDNSDDREVGAEESSKLYNEHFAAQLAASLPTLKSSLDTESYDKLVKQIQDLESDSVPVKTKNEISNSLKSNKELTKAIRKYRYEKGQIILPSAKLLFDLVSQVKGYLSSKVRDTSFPDKLNSSLGDIGRILERYRSPTTTDESYLLAIELTKSVKELLSLLESNDVISELPSYIENELQKVVAKQESNNNILSVLRRKTGNVTSEEAKAILSQFKDREDGFEEFKKLYKK